MLELKVKHFFAECHAPGCAKAKFESSVKERRDAWVETHQRVSRHTDWAIRMWDQMVKEFV